MSVRDIYGKKRREQLVPAIQEIPTPQAPAPSEGDPLLGALGSIAGTAIGGAIAGPAGASVGASLGGQLGGKGTVDLEQTAVDSAKGAAGSALSGSLSNAISDTAGQQAGALASAKDLNINPMGQQAQMLGEAGADFAPGAFDELEKKKWYESQYFNEGAKVKENIPLLKKFAKTDRYGNSISYEFDVPAPANQVPDMSYYDHPGKPKGTDTVPAWLTPGERVMNAEAEREYGPLLAQMNEHGRAIQAAQGGTIPEYAAGGCKVKYAAKGSKTSCDCSECSRTVYAAEGEKVTRKPSALDYEQAQIDNAFKYLFETPPMKAANYIKNILSGGGTIADDGVPYWFKEGYSDRPVVQYESDGGVIYANSGVATEEYLNKLMMQESGGDPSAINPRTGASGAYQWMLESSQEPGYGVKGGFDRFDPIASRNATKGYIEGMMGQENWNLADATAAYNWGPGNMKKWIAGGRNIEDMPVETQNYVQSILEQKVEGQPIPNREPIPSVPNLETETSIPESNIDYNNIETMGSYLSNQVQKGMPYETARGALISQFGVSPGVADSYLDSQYATPGTVKGIKGIGEVADEIMQGNIAGSDFKRVGDPLSQDQEVPRMTGEGIPEVPSIINQQDTSNQFIEQPEDARGPAYGQGLRTQLQSVEQQLVNLQEEAKDPRKAPQLIGTITELRNQRNRLADMYDSWAATQGEKVSIGYGFEQAVPNYTQNDITLQSPRGELEQRREAQLITEEPPKVPEVPEAIPTPTTEETKAVETKKETVTTEKQPKSDILSKDEALAKVRSIDAVTLGDDQGEEYELEPEERTLWNKAKTYLNEMSSDVNVGTFLGDIAQGISNFVSDSGLLDSQELKRAALLAAGSMAFGYSLEDSVNWAAKGYVKRIDAKSAANAETQKEFNAHINKLIEDDTFDPKSVKLYRKTKDPSVLKSKSDTTKEFKETKLYVSRNLTGEPVQRMIGFDKNTQRFFDVQTGQDVTNTMTDYEPYSGDFHNTSRIMEEARSYLKGVATEQGFITSESTKTDGTTTRKENYSVDITGLTSAYSAHLRETYGPGADIHLNKPEARNRLAAYAQAAHNYFENTGKKVTNYKGLISEVDLLGTEQSQLRTDLSVDRNGETTDKAVFTSVNNIINAYKKTNPELAKLSNSSLLANAVNIYNMDVETLTDDQRKAVEYIKGLKQDPSYPAPLNFTQYYYLYKAKGMDALKRFEQKQK